MRAPVFQVTGLARCGSAFISTMFNLEHGCICFHDLAATDKGWKDTIERERHLKLIVGDVSTYGFTPKAVIAESKKVFIDKPWQESRVAAAKALGYEVPEADYELFSEMAKRWVFEWSPLVIPSTELWNLDSMRKIWKHCMVTGAPFPEQKVSLLLGMNIQRLNPEVVFRRDIFAGREHELF